MTNTLEKFPDTLEKRLDELCAANEALRAEINSQEDIKPNSGWSISEIAHHLYIVEKGITGMLQKAIQSSERCERKTNDVLEKEWENIVSFTSNRQERFNAPSFTVPTNTAILSETINLLTESHNKLANLLTSTSLEELASIAKPHAIESVGLISGLGWLSLIARHKLRHVEQIKELKQNSK
jgi:DinB superfamily